MDTISRENNSMLPVGAIIVGAIALLLGGYAVITLSKVNKSLAEHDEKLAKVAAIESSAGAAAVAADKASKDVHGLRNSMQEAVNTLAAELSSHRGSITKLEERASKAVASKETKKASGTPAAAGANEYAVKAGDTGTKIATATGVSVKEIEAANPGIDWTKLKPGQKLKLPAKK